MAIFPLWDGEKKMHTKNMFYIPKQQKNSMSKMVLKIVSRYYLRSYEHLKHFNFLREKDDFCRENLFTAIYLRLVNLKREEKKALVAFCSIKIQKYLALRLKKFHTKNMFLHAETSKKLNIKK